VVAKAEEINAKFIVVHMNTYGGLLDEADQIRYALINTEIPTIVFIDNNAASAGSLISLACDSIYMRKGGNMGASTVVNFDGTRALDKYQSYMRRQMRSTAESNGKITKVIDGDTAEVDDSTKIITLTTEDALQWGYCEGTPDSLEQVISLLGESNSSIVKVTPTTLDNFLAFLDDPVTKYLLFIMITLGVILIGLEIFVIPGFGLAGITGIIFFIVGILLSILTSINFDMGDGDNSLLKLVLTIMIFTILGIGVLAYLFGGRVLRSSIFRKVVNEDTITGRVDIQPENTNIDDMVGKTGLSSSALRPMGRINIDGTNFEAKTYGEFIDKDKKIKVISIENRYLVVKSI